MRSFLTTWFLTLKLEVTLEEAIRLRTPILDLRSHGLENCPNFLALPSDYVAGLKYLLLQSNLLGYFSRVNCHSLENLQGLCLDYNRLEDIPFDFRHLENLTVLNVSHNPFQNLHFLHVVCQLKNLKVLWANATGIREIPVEIKELNKLRILGLRRNHITRLPQELMGLKALRWLTLASNEISEIPSEISHLSKLVHLCLQRNYIQRLPESFNQLPELQYLFLDYNQINVDEHFRSFISSLPKLIYCSVAKNFPNAANNGVLAEQISRSERTQSTVPPSRNPITSNTTSVHRLTDVGLIGADREINDNSTESTNIMPTVRNGRQSLHTMSGGNDDAVGGDARLLGIHTSRVMVAGTDSFLLTSNYHHQSGSGCFQEADSSVLELIRESAEDSDINSGEEGYINDNCAIVTESGVERDVKSGFPHSSSDTEIDYEVEIDCELPFANSSVASIRKETSSSSSGATSVGTLFYEDVENGNTRSASTTREHEIPRDVKFGWTQEWVLHHHNNNNDNSLWPQMMCEMVHDDKQKYFDGNATKESVLVPLVQGQVDNLINDAAKEVVEMERSKQSASATTSTSMIYIMPHARKPQPYSLNASANFTCNRAMSSSSSMFVSPSDSASSLFVTVQSPWNDNPITSQSSLCHIPDRSVRICASTNFLNRDAATATSSSNRAADRLNATISSNLEVNDVESNYDLSDWEHSAPSSAIDDQDIIGRFADVGEEETGNVEYVPLNEREWLRILTLGLMK